MRRSQRTGRSASFIWENTWYEKEQVNEYDLTIFARTNGEYYQKFFETHYQKAYELETVKELIQKSGMEFVAAYDAFTREPVRADSERIYIIAREKGKRRNRSRYDRLYCKSDGSGQSDPCLCRHDKRNDRICKKSA